IDAREEGVELARQQYKPDWMVDVGYGYRGGERADGRSRPGFVSVMLTLDVPLFRRNRQDRTFAAALSEQRAASASRDELRRRLLSRLESEYYRWRELSRRVDLYQRRIVPQAQEHARAALAAYQSEAADFSDVMRGYIDELDTRLEHVRLRVERAQSYAVIANLGGIEP
ncbi:MAG: TolC family protein, partial [Gammaproteobacteria bacterium]